MVEAEGKDTVPTLVRSLRAAALKDFGIKDFAA
jgi:hypothetical protein